MIAVVDSGGANVSSVLLAIERAGGKAVFTADADVIRNVSHVILPGVGAAKTAMQAFEENGLIDCLRELTQPTLGICLGMQLLFTRSQEGDVPCLDILSGSIEKFPVSDLSVPHTGWNQVRQVKRNPLFHGISDNAYLYFVHSFYVPQNSAAIGESDYGVTFTSAVCQDNFYGCQFYPERSGAIGEHMIRNFLAC